MMKRIISLFSMIALMATSLFAQESGSGLMRSNGKFYVVVAVLITIFVGLIIFMTMVERRISKLEKEVEE